MDKQERKKLRERQIEKGLTVVAQQEEETATQAPPHRRYWIVLLLILIVAAVAGAGVYYSLSGRTYNDYEVLAEYEVDDASSMEYLIYGDNYIKYSKDGVSYIDSSNHTVWVESYAMKMPYAVVSGDYIAIADLNGNEVYLFGKEGKLSQTTTQYTITDIDVALQGVFVVVMESDNGNEIISYDKNGEKIAEMTTTAQSSGYPLDVALSPDGQKLVISYTYFEGMTLKNRIGTHNFGPVGQNENADRFVGGFELDDTLVSKVKFIGDSTICAFGDDRLIFYSMKEKPSEITQIPYSQEIKSIFFNDLYAGTICEKQGAEGSNQYELKVYNTSGKQVVSIDVDIAYSHVHATKDRIIVSGDSECRIYDYNGNCLFSYSFAKKLLNLVPMGDKREYMAVYENGSEYIRLTTKKDEVEERP